MIQLGIAAASLAAPSEVPPTAAQVVEHSGVALQLGESAWQTADGGLRVEFRGGDFIQAVELTVADQSSTVTRW